MTLHSIQDFGIGRGQIVVKEAFGGEAGSGRGCVHGAVLSEEKLGGMAERVRPSRDGGKIFKTRARQGAWRISFAWVRRVP